jgi:hypothetical protein
VETKKEEEMQQQQELIRPPSLFDHFHANEGPKPDDEWEKERNRIRHRIRLLLLLLLLGTLVWTTRPRKSPRGYHRWLAEDDEEDSSMESIIFRSGRR